ncbi:GP88 family protein [Blautia hansenii]|uniref:Gene product 88 domain-containing protein n=1 Tax=Blautia hansenii DSM 20583 TaxID=537007 RepID=C9L7Q3_BLAHA|nr:hypothetical protein [Blautia hansenii]ASM69785.1 hypothetical protein CGC63_09575 [Blautia hansenii DSM 20583]EEX21798.1 hypothetical protein BLAHAN_05423 [Blautia hansenii DSM 20583]UWO09541.1 hypothetical protein NQ538_09630 [Blautia hansenii DSM 20583]
MNVKISNGNSKMGKIPSVSFPSLLTCIKCDCNKICYAHKLEKLRPSVRQSYLHNWNLYKSDRETYWREIEATIMLSRFFRFHVSGDIPDQDYIHRMIDVANRHQHCEILCFTKKFDMCNKEISERKGELPNNLHLIYSGWKNLKMKNPYNLPEAHVRYRDGTTTAMEEAIECDGDCTECAITDSGCWVLKKGEQVVFTQH